MTQQVVVTGLGVISPIGNSVDEFTRALFAGQSGADYLTRFDATGLDTRFAAEVKNIPSEYKDVKIGYAMLAAAQAMNHAFGEMTEIGAARSQLSIGIGLELFTLPDLIKSRNPDFTLPNDYNESMTFLNTPSDICAHMISAQFQFKQPPMIHISACAASTDAIGTAFEAIKVGELDVALAGGCDSMINPMGFTGFSRIGALSSFNQDPASASKPFDQSRDGFVLGEGAGFLVLESYHHAKARGANILAEISGYGNSLDAYSVSDPHPDGAGALRAMKAALKSAKISSDAISAVNAHGTSTEKNDPAEAIALQKLFGENVDNVPVSATKSMIGHLISASGAVESIAVVQCIRNNKLHQTLNLNVVDDKCQLNHVKDQPLLIELKHVLKNSFGFGGKNACLVISAYEN